MENEILFEIRKRYDGFRKSEKKVADFLMNFEGPLSSLNLELTAKRAGVSQPTVVRFAKALKELHKGRDEDRSAGGREKRLRP